MSESLRVSLAFALAVLREERITDERMLMIATAIRISIKVNPEEVFFILVYVVVNLLILQVVVHVPQQVYLRSKFF